MHHMMDKMSKMWQNEPQPWYINLPIYHNADLCHMLHFCDTMIDADAQATPNSSSSSSDIFLDLRRLVRYYLLLLTL